MKKKNIDFKKKEESIDVQDSIDELGYSKVIKASTVNIK